MPCTCRTNRWNKMVDIISLQITFAWLLINMVLKFSINSGLIVLDNTSTLHSRNFWSIVVCLIYHCWLVCLLQRDLSCLLEWVRLLSGRIRNGSGSSSAIDWKNSRMAWIIWYAFRSSLVCLTVKASLSLLLVVTEAGTLDCSTKITILSTIPLSLNLCLPRHVLQIGAIDTIGLRVVSRHAWISIVRKLPGPIRGVCIWEIFLKSIFKQ